MTEQTIVDQSIKGEVRNFDTLKVFFGIGMFSTLARREFYFGGTGKMKNLVQFPFEV